MKLHLLELNDNCSICGSPPIEERIAYEDALEENLDGVQYKTERHYRKFSCGKEIKSRDQRFNPETLSQCSNELAIKHKKQQRQTAKDKLIEFCLTLDVDDDFKSSLRCALNCREFY